MDRQSSRDRQLDVHRGVEPGSGRRVFCRGDPVTEVGTEVGSEWQRWPEQLCKEGSSALPDKARVNSSVQRISDFAEIVNTVQLAKRSGSDWLRLAPIVVAV